MPGGRGARGFFNSEVALGGFKDRPMTSDKRPPPGALTLLVGTILLGASSTPALAQAGWGWGVFGPLNIVPTPTDFLNQHALNRAALGRREPTSFRPYANSSNAYFNRIRDNGFVNHSDVRRRQPPVYRQERARSLGQAANVPAGTSPASATAAPSPLPLASFFDASKTLVWPSESPLAGDLKAKRDFSDQASLAVLDETKQYQAASITTVTEARQRLLDYGRPALQAIRAESTPRIADVFHSFLLALYDSLEQAASPPDAPPGHAPKP
jgi:hypothetical protein